MRPVQRRRLDRIWILLGAGVVGLAALIAAFAGDTERIGAYWTHAHIDDAGLAAVTEVIDYDFGSNQRHGILRQIPDVAPSTPFTVASPSAPDQVTIQPWWLGTELRVGDPNTTISNRHRYTITYPHGGLIEGNRVGWNAVGDGWTVTVHDVEVHVTADRELLDPSCDTGSLGRTGGCVAVAVGPGHIMVTHDQVRSGEFLTVWADLGDPVDATFPAVPTGPAPDPGVGWKTTPLLAGFAALLGAALLSPLIRRLGREWMWEGGSVDAAFGPGDEGTMPQRQVDHSELREMTTIEFEPPRDLSAAVGGVIHLERVHDDHKTAWLLEAAIREEIELDTVGALPTIRRGSVSPNPSVGAVLGHMFGTSDVISLGAYDPTFASGWKELSARLESWRESSGMWDSRGHRRRALALGFGLVGVVVGVGLTVLGAAMANRTGSGWYPVVAVGGAIAGLGIAAISRAWELRVRTAEGSGAWIRIESFRRFLHDSEAEHVERAAEMGMLRQYTAWAVSLGEVDRWENAVREAAATPGSAVAGYQHTNFALTAPLLASAVSTASTAPSSSGGGGGGGGGSGGGGGGGGGGSW